MRYGIRQTFFLLYNLHIGFLHVLNKSNYLDKTINPNRYLQVHTHTRIYILIHVQRTSGEKERRKQTMEGREEGK